MLKMFYSVKCMLRCFFAIGLFFCLIAPVNAAQDSKGSEFWIAFMQNYTQTPNLQLFITSDVNTTGTVEIPGLNWSTQFTVAANITTTVNIPSDAMATGSGTSDKGIHVVANNEVTIYGLNQITYTTDAFLALPVNALNLTHYVMSYQSSSPGEFAIAASYDNTAISYAVPGQSPQSITLNKGQVFQLQSNDKLTGTYIEADKPVAVFGGNVCVNIPPGYGACDHIVEQIPPLTTWGKLFYTVPLATRLRGDTFVILSGSNDNVITINGTPVATLQAGQSHELVISDMSVILTSAPALVSQFSNGSDYDGVTSDPFMMIVPPVEQSLANYTFSTPGSGFTTNFVNVLAPADITSSITLDGILLNSSLFTPISGTTFSGAQVPVGVGSHTISGSKNFGIHSYGFASYDSYGYPGGMAFETINPSRITFASTLINYGKFPLENVSSINELRELQLLNDGDSEVTISSIMLNGKNSSDYTIISVNGVSVNGSSYTTPFKLWPRAAMPIKVALKPISSPVDLSYDASLTVLGKDKQNNTVTTVATLGARLETPSIVVHVLDASPTITEINDAGVPLNYKKQHVTESEVAAIDENGKLKRVGLVADGNARLFLRATTDKTSGYLTFTINQPSQSEAVLSSLSLTSNEDKTTSVSVPVGSGRNGHGQATAILRAAERFAGDPKNRESNIDVTVCYQETLGSKCFNTDTRIREKRAPVVLIHGLWANNESWWDKVDASKPTMYIDLMKAGFSVGRFEYSLSSDAPANRGPSEVMATKACSNDGLTGRDCLANKIKSSNGQEGRCNILEKQGFACTRADLVVHSMGGLMARKFISGNEYYDNTNNFKKGAVRRLITLGTPHLGSQLANLLRNENEYINNCIKDDMPLIPGLQSNALATVKLILFAKKQTIQSAIQDIAIGSQLLKDVNGSTQNVPTFALYGDIGHFLLDSLVAEHLITTKVGCSHADLFGTGMNSDGIVPVNSATANEILPIINTDKLSDIAHMGMGTNQDVIDKVIPLLTDSRGKFANGI